VVLFDKDKLAAQLRALGELPQIREVKALRQRLEKELERLSVQEIEEKIHEIVSPNVKRSSKLSRYWRYVKLIHDNFSDLTIKDIRSQLKKRQQGEETDIPDAVWQNPSG